MSNKEGLLKRIKDVDDRLLAFCNSKPNFHPERLTVNELKKLLSAFETMYGLLEKSANMPAKKEKFKIGDYVMPISGCNKDIPCRVIETYHPTMNSEQFITVIPLRSTDILKGHTASKTKQNKYSASWRIFKFIPTLKYGDGREDDGLYIWKDGDLVPLLDENGNPMKKIKENLYE